MKRRIIGVFLIILLVFGDIHTLVYAKETPDEPGNLYAQSAVLMDADSGRILFGKNENQRLPMASTTKIMTCILTLEQMEYNQIGTVSEYAAKQPKVHLGVKSQEEFYILDLLYSLMLESHNDSAVIIAETIGGSVEAFAEMMNRKAAEIGCENTYFITPNGLDAEDDVGIHSTTAADLSLIMRYCIQESSMKEEFIKITQTPTYQFTDVSGKRSFSCHNHNAFLTMMEGALSGKTGFTNDAGYCYVGALRQGERTFIVSLLACGWPNNKGYKWKDTRKLMEYGLDNYEYYIVSQKKNLQQILVENGMDTEEPMRKTVYADVRIQNHNSDSRVLRRKDEEIETKIVLKNKVQAPVIKNEVVGTVFYTLDGYIIDKNNIVTSEAVEKKSRYIMWIYILDLYFL